MAKTQGQGNNKQTRQSSSLFKRSRIRRHQVSIVVQTGAILFEWEKIKIGADLREQSIQ